MVFAERKGHADDVAFLKGAYRQGVLHLGDGAVRGFGSDELDGLGFIKPQGGQLPAQAHLEVVGQVHGGFRHEGAPEPGGDAVQAEHAHDFFQKVAGAGEVQPMRRNQPVFGFHLFSGDFRHGTQPQGRQDARALLMRDGAAGNLVQFRPGQADKAKLVFHRGALALLQGGEYGGGAVRSPAEGNGGVGGVRRRFSGHIRGGSRAARQFQDKLHGTHGTTQRIPRGRASFKTVGGVGRQGQPARRGAHGGGLEPGGFQNDVHGGLGHAAFLPAHHTADGKRLAGLVRHDQIRTVERVLLAVQSLDGFPFIGGAGDDAALHPGRVKRMKRGSLFMQDEVGDVHNVVDGAQSDGDQPLLQPFRAFLHLHAADFHGGVVRVDFRLVQTDEVPGGFQLHLGVVDRDGLVFAAGDGGQFKGHAVVGEQVRTVGRHFHFHDGIRFHDLGDGHAHFQLLRQYPEAVLLVRQPQLGGGTQHAAGFHAAQLAHLDFNVARKNRARQGAGNLVARLVVLRSAHDLVQRAVAHVHLADFQAVRLRVLFGGGHARHYHQGGIHALLADVFHLNPGKGQHVRHFVHAQTGQVNVLGKPIKGNFHIWIR